MTSLSLSATHGKPAAPIGSTFLRKYDPYTKIPGRMGAYANGGGADMNAMLGGVGVLSAHAARSRIALLYLVSRRMLHSLFAIAAIFVAVWWLGGVVDPAQVTNPFVIPRNQTLIVHMAAAFLASIIGIAVWTPFGETERISPVMLPVMRAVHLIGLLVIGLSGVSIIIASWPDVMPGIDLVTLFARNTLFLTGCVLLTGKALDVRLAWMLPMMLGGITIVAILQRLPRMESVQEMWQLQAWNVLGQDQTNGMANAICLGLGIAVIAVYIRDGVKDSDEAE